MNRQRARLISIGLIAALFVLGCITPFIAPTSPQSAQSLDAIGTAIVQTANAAQTQTAAVLPAPTNTLIASQILLPTQTLPPTQTPLILVSLTPTATQGLLVMGPNGTLVSATPAVNSSIASTSSGGNSTVTEKVIIKTPKEWDCIITEKNPARGAIVKPGAEINLFWTILNSGVKSWPSYGVDFIYTGGYRSEGKPIQDLPVAVAVGKSITLRVPITTPKNPGIYNVFWSLKVGNTYFCHMKITFEVQ